MPRGSMTGQHVQRRPSAHLLPDQSPILEFHQTFTLFRADDTVNEFFEGMLIASEM